MRVTVLGSSASYAGAGQACAGHLRRSRRRARAASTAATACSPTSRKIADPPGARRGLHHPQPPRPLRRPLRAAGAAALRTRRAGAPLPLYLPDGLFERMRCLLSDRGAERVRRGVRADHARDAMTRRTRSAHDGHAARRRAHAPDVRASSPRPTARGSCYTADTAASDGALRRGARVPTCCSPRRRCPSSTRMPLRT